MVFFFSYFVFSPQNLGRVPIFDTYFSDVWCVLKLSTTNQWWIELKSVKGRFLKVNNNLLTAWGLRRWWLNIPKIWKKLGYLILLLSFLNGTSWLFRWPLTEICLPSRELTLSHLGNRKWVETKPQNVLVLGSVCNTLSSRPGREKWPVRRRMQHQGVEVLQNELESIWRKVASNHFYRTSGFLYRTIFSVGSDYCL